MKNRILFLTALLIILLSSDVFIHKNENPAIYDIIKNETNEKTSSSSAISLIDAKNDVIILENPESLSNYKFQIDGLDNFERNLNFEGTNNYKNIQGISTFRGSNFRDGGAYGNATLTDKKFTKIWDNIIGKIDSWGGVGWNGQPSIIKWDDDIRVCMNLYAEYKYKENFTEVIYGALDGVIHFYDLDTGLPSRDSIKLPSSIKGSVTIDPRGYPLLYVGQGIDKVSGESVRCGYHIFSLITGKELFFINGRDKYAYVSWPAFDGNPIIDINSDTMILPGENGIIYFVLLNTNLDLPNGTISVSPIITKYRYNNNGYAVGVENSIAAFKNYAFFANNSGLVQCIDLNELKPIWAFQMEDDTDASIVIEQLGDELSLYVGCEVDRRRTKCASYVRKINALTGKEIWSYNVPCLYDANVNGGILSTPLVGKNSISDLVIFNFTKTTSLRSGKIVALNKENGNVVWEKDLSFYSWSSPTAIYEDDGTAYIILCDAGGRIFLLDGKTGETLTSISTNGNIEGSPAIFENHIVVGTRGGKIYRIDVN